MATSFGRRRLLQVAGGVAVAAGCAVAVKSSTPFLRHDGPVAPLPPLPDPHPGTLGALTPADPHASADVRTMLRWLAGLRARTSRKVVSGQQIPADAAWGYQQYVQRLADQTGHYVAQVGVGFNDLWTSKIPPVLIDHWRAGGLVTMEFFPTSPWDPADGVNSGWVKNVNGPKPDLRVLLADAKPSPQRTLWRAQLAKLGDALEELGSAGVTVLFRPLAEPNGNWYWWCHDMTRHQPTAEAALYRDVYEYIVDTRGLHNVLWVYSPCASWNAPTMAYYPGEKYVDVIAPTCYDDQLFLLGDKSGQRDHSDYRDVLAAGKPLGFGECGPTTRISGNWDARTIINRIRDNYTGMCYFQCWHGWDNTIMQLADDQHATELMNDPWVITRDAVDWRTA